MQPVTPQAQGAGPQRALPACFGKLGEGLVARLSQIWLYCLSDGVPKRSGRVALVGVLLNLINQGDALLGHGHVNVIKLVLTFVVPYCVATYGAVSFRLALERARQQPEDGFNSTGLP